MASTMQFDVTAPDDTQMHQRAEFRALLAEHASLVRAADAYTQATGDFDFVVREMLRDPLLVQFMTPTDGLADAGDDVLQSNSVKDLALSTIAAQRVALCVRRDRLFTRIAERADVLLGEIRYNEQFLARDAEVSAPELRHELERDLALAKAAYADLVALTRVLLEHLAAREVATMYEQGPAAVPPQALYGTMRAAAMARASGVDFAVRHQQPLRSALVLELGLEAARAPATPTANVQADPSRPTARVRR